MTAIPANRYAVIDRIIAAEIYLYIIFMFLTKGEAIRNILLFSAFILWLSILKYRENKRILKKPIPVLFAIFIGTIILSSVFSINPGYSFKSILDDPLKATILLCLLCTVLADEKRLRKFAFLMFLILVFTLSAGYYSYWTYDLPLMKPVTWIRHAWHSRFAMDINALLPFTLILFLTTKDTRGKTLLFITIITAILGIVLSTARGGIAAFLFILSVWLIFLAARRKINLNIIMAIGGAIILFSVIAVFCSPQVKEKFVRTREDVKTLTERTIIWNYLISAAYERPFFGWGYGDKIFRSDIPFRNTPYKAAPVHLKAAFRNPHNSFLKIFFHQGIAGLIPYIALIIVSALAFLKGGYRTNDFQSYMLIACAGIIIGTFLVNSMSENPHLTDLTLILGIGIASQNLKTDRDQDELRF